MGASVVSNVGMYQELRMSWWRRREDESATVARDLRSCLFFLRFRRRFFVTCSARFPSTRDIL